jgi:luciferase family oxidoreductase group 1
MMRLSVLDQSPIFADQTAADALGDTLALAEAAEAFGYARYWVAEHHATDSFAGTAPEILIPAIAARTRTIRVGAGGIMLTTDSPLKVAEQFLVLEGLHPGRIDLAFGRAVGGTPRTGAALRNMGPEHFAQLTNLLLTWLLDATGGAPIPAGSPITGVHAGPRGPAAPFLSVLCMSTETAAFAGAMGLSMVFAEFLNPGGGAAALRAYRESFAPGPFADRPYAGIGVSALAAPSAREAERRAATSLAWILDLMDGRPGRFLGEAAAAADLAQRRAHDPRLAQIAKRAIVGAPEVVADQLAAVAAATRADELFVITLAPDNASRIESYRLIAEAAAQKPAATAIAQA